MKFINIHKILIFIFCAAAALPASDNRPLAMGGMRVSLPDVYHQFNLWQSAANPAGLLDSDSLNWMFYSGDHLRRTNEIRRRWDARELRFTDLVFSGQKRLNSRQMFYGYFRYGWENRIDARYSIDRHPYDLDPFVLTDSTEGNIGFYGPEIYAAYTYRLRRNVSIGGALRYTIQQGLKTIFTRPEIIHRRISADIGLSLKLNDLFTAGLTFTYFDKQDLTKLVTQPDKLNPITYRYRGEYTFKKVIGKGDRVADYDGYALGPQIAWNNGFWEGIFTAGYFYRWHELYDDPVRRIYDGSYQERRYYARLQNRYYFDALQKSLLALDIHYGYIENWAKEPKAGYMIYNAFYRNYGIIVGFSHRFETPSLTVAAEGQFERNIPDRRDHLAHVYRYGPVDQNELRTGLEYTVKNIFRLRAGVYYIWYREDPVWRYFGDLNGPGFTAGMGYYAAIRQIDFYIKYGRLNSANPAQQINVNSSFDFILNWRQFF